MVSPTALTCNHYAARCTKIGTKILCQKNSKKEENAPDSARKRRNRVRFGCWREVQPVRGGEKTRNPNQNVPNSNATHEKKRTGRNPEFPPVLWQGQKDLNPRHAVLEWMWESAPGSEEGSVLPDFLDKSETGWCCFGAVGKIGTVMDGKFPILGTIALFGKI
jgi:hypothetical protein